MPKFLLSLVVHFIVAGIIGYLIFFGFARVTS
jgi:hypothetical protein